jgi:general secretion pathway protein G
VNRFGVTLLWILAALLAFFIIAPRLLVLRDEPPRASAAKAQIEQLMTALHTFHCDVGAYPTEEQGLQALRPYLQKEVPLDPWGHPYQYSLVNGRPRIVSRGVGSPDGAISSDGR